MPRDEANWEVYVGCRWAGNFWALGDRGGATFFPPC